MIMKLTKLLVASISASAWHYKVKLPEIQNRTRSDVIFVHVAFATGSQAGSPHMKQ